MAKLHKNQQFIVEVQTTLLAFLLDKLSPQSRTKIKALLGQGRVMVNGEISTKFNQILPENSVVEIVERKISNSLPLNVLYEDDWIIVIEKPSGLLSVGNPTSTDESAWSLLKNYGNEQRSKFNVYVCHRLDQYTSGILLFAKTQEVQDVLRNDWNSYVQDRRYIAVTEQIPNPQRAEIRSYLAENSAMQVYSVRNPQHGKLAITRYSVLATNGNLALLDVQILTGRKNQIRVQLSEHGWCIAGDRKYGAKTDPEHRLMLHNNKLEFIHPVLQRVMTFELPIPKSFSKHFKLYNNDTRRSNQ